MAKQKDHLRLELRIEHKQAVAGFDQNSKVAGHVHLFGHNMNLENVCVVGFESKYHERFFLETWQSTLDQPRSQGTLSTSRKYPGYGWSRV